MAVSSKSYQGREVEEGSGGGDGKKRERGYYLSLMPIGKFKITSGDEIGIGGSLQNTFQQEINGNW
jgi:hypothetical protein